MQVWIDAAAETPITIFGLRTSERLERGIAKLRPAATGTVLSPADAGSQEAGSRLRAHLATGPKEPVLVLDGASVVDTRLLMHAAAAPGSFAILDGEDGEATALVRLEPDAFGTVPEDAWTVRAIAERMVAAGAVRRGSVEEVPSFLVNLRRDLTPYLFRVSDAAGRDRRERFMFWSNYKGSTDFLTRWVYPPLVWQLVRAATSVRLHPNWITIAGTILTFAAVPFFAEGMFWAGLAMAYAMTVLDSVDGKVARLTLTDSAIGNLLDHGIDIVHPPLWYMAWAWGLGGSDPDSLLFQAGLWLVGFYVADRLVLMVAKAWLKRGLHAVAPIDRFVRTFIARRNVNLVILTIGLIVGYPAEAFLVIVAWQGITCLWHAVRTGWLMLNPPAYLRAARA